MNFLGKWQQSTIGNLTLTVDACKANPLPIMFAPPFETHIPLHQNIASFA